MRYTKTVDIWSTNPATLQIGQWVTAGNDPTAKGIYLGVKPSGSLVVAWYRNAKSNQYKSYIRTLRNYALGA